MPRVRMCKRGLRPGTYVRTNNGIVCSCVCVHNMNLSNASWGSESDLYSCHILPFGRTWQVLGPHVI